MISKWMELLVSILSETISFIEDSHQPQHGFILMFPLLRINVGKHSIWPFHNYEKIAIIKTKQNKRQYSGSLASNFQCVQKFKTNMNEFNLTDKIASHAHNQERTKKPMGVSLRWCKSIPKTDPLVFGSVRNLGILPGV